MVLRGHAIECRINAEDPDRGLRARGRPARHLRGRRAGPGPGSTRTATPAGRSRPFYDSLIAKLIVWAPDRAGGDRPDGCARCSEFQIEGRGVKTTIPFHRSVLADEQFRSGDVSTDFVEQFMAEEAAAA